MTSDTSRNVVLAAVLALVAALFLSIAQEEPIPELEEHERYCRMVKLYEQSRGEYGWPPYKGPDACEQHQ